MRTPDFDSWEFRPSTHPTDLAEREKFYADLPQRFLAELCGNKAVEDFCAAYEPKSAQVFLRKYAEAKANAVRYASYHIKRIEGTREIQFPDDTRDAYDAILQKKLFNIQLRWRAEQIDLRPHVLVSDDFMYWGDHIRECPFLDPVTEEELETMRAYLRQPFFEYLWFQRARFDQYYNFYVGKKASDPTDNYEEPDWYQFYNGRHGTGALTLLPDLRGDIEERYLAAAREKRKADAARQPPAAPYVPGPPYMHAGFKELIAFAEAADDPCFEAIFRDNQEMADSRQRAAEASGVVDPGDIITFLEDINDPPLVPRAGVSWQRAAADVWNAYMSEAVAADLELEHDTYQMFRATGIRLTENENHESPIVRSRGEADTLEEARKWKADMLLDGREWLGEPRDLNF